MTTQPEALSTPQHPTRVTSGRLGRPVLWLRGLVGRHLSVRWKLTLWYSFMVALTLGLVGVGMRLALTREINSTIDGSLRSTAAGMLAKLGHASTAYTVAAVPGTCSSDIYHYCVQIRSELEQYSTRVSAPGQFERVLLIDTQSGRSAQLNSPGAAGIPFGYPPLLARVASGQTTFENAQYRGEAYRVYLTQLVPPPTLRSRVAGVLEVFQTEHSYLIIQRDLDQLFILGIPLGVIIAIVAGWWIARAALRPIDRISRTVQTIGESQDLSRRLDFVGPVDEVGRLADTFDRMMDRLEGVFDTQRRFVADASHELRTPLTAIRGNADLIAIAPPEEREICVASIRREAERMSRMVSDLLLLAESDIEPHAIRSQPVRLDEILEEVHRSTLLLAGDKIEVALDISGPITVQGDPDRLKQVFLNLTDNAVKFTAEGGRIHLALRPAGSEVRVTVSDTGIGIPPQEQKAIFGRFYRVEESRSSPGSGLGLAISSRIVEAHGGRIDVDSQRGRGSKFTVILPLAGSTTH